MLDLTGREGLLWYFDINGFFCIKNSILSACCKCCVPVSDCSNADRNVFAVHFQICDNWVLWDHLGCISWQLPPFSYSYGPAEIQEGQVCLWGQSLTLHCWNYTSVLTQILHLALYWVSPHVYQTNRKEAMSWRAGNVVPARKEDAQAALFSELELFSSGILQMRASCCSRFCLSCWCSGTEPHGAGSAVWLWGVEPCCAIVLEKEV